MVFEMQTSNSGTLLQQISAFRVGEQTFGIPALLIEEFFRPLPVTRVPGSDSRVDGVVNIRGTNAVVVNLRSCLDLPPTPEQESEMILLETEQGLVDEARHLDFHAFNEPVVLRIDETLKIYNVPWGALHPPPAHINCPFVEGVIETDDVYITLLSCTQLIQNILRTSEEALS